MQAQLEKWSEEGNQDIEKIHTKEREIEKKKK